MAKCQLSKIRQNCEKRDRSRFLCVMVVFCVMVIVQMYHCLGFKEDLLMCKISYVNTRKCLNKAKFPLLKIRQKLDKNQTAPIFCVEVTTVQMYHFATFEADLTNNVQNFPRKPPNVPKYG